MLAAAPAVRADDTAPVATAETPQGAPAAAPASVATDGAARDAGATATTSAGGDQSAAAGDAPAGASGTAGADGASASDTTAPGNSGAAPGHSDPGPGSSDAAPGHSDPGPGSSDAAPGHSDPGPGNSDAAPGHSDGEQGASVAQSADSGANAQQQGVGNTNVDVRVDKPGNGPQVSQGNRAEGSAEAATTTESSTPAASDQSATAVAAATQADVQNTAVIVRVGSAGDDAGVEQSNIVAATASTTVVPPANGASEVDERASAAATQDGVANTSVSIRVFSPGTDGPLTQTNDAAATADTSGPGGASATATQNDVQNTHVSVRVESSGTSGPVSQQSASSTTAGSGVAVATTGNGVDTDLSVVVGGDHLAQPGANGLEVWIWTWNWYRDESDALGTSVDAQPTSWDWIWSAANGQTGDRVGQVTTRTPTQDEQTPGAWTWSWSWTREGVPNWLWQWDRHGALPCASCVWIWNWTWNWAGQPAPTGSTAAPPDTPNLSGAVEQTNVVVASAVATVSADVTQTIAQDGAGEQFAGQLVTVDQLADASASATQSDVVSVATADLLAPQLNRVTGHAFVTVAGDLVQRVEQTMLVDEDGTAAQWSGQEIDLVQHARADVRVTQRGVSVRTAGTHVAAGVSSAEAAASVDQRVVQDALVDGGETDQSAGQLALLEQTGTAVSTVDQTDAPAARFVGGTARARSAGSAVARVAQDVAQSAARGGGLGSQTAMQIAYVGQTGVASATTSQRAGHTPSSLAASDATAANRALVVQIGLQESSGTLALDVQDLTQQSIVVQDAVAVSTSAGGIAGAALVVNCAIVQQTAAQSLSGGSVAASNADLGAFCVPPSAVPTGGSGPEPDPVLLSDTSTALAVASPASTSVPMSDVDVALSHGRLSTVAAPVLQARATTPPVSAQRSEPGAGRPATGLPLNTRISVPPPTQARLDTRPGDHAGAGDAGREPPLPPAGDPPLWVSALAAAAAGGAGPSGIAAILVAFALVPPLLVRAREGSVVRRPIEVLSQVDVPV